jgi:hypothetical protein
LEISPIPYTQNREGRELNRAASQYQLPPNTKYKEQGEEEIKQSYFPGSYTHNKGHETERLPNISCFPIRYIKNKERMELNRAAASKYHIHTTRRGGNTVM